MMGARRRRLVSMAGNGHLAMDYGLIGAGLGLLWLQ